jgi:acylpyruvate hydrolase
MPYISFARNGRPVIARVHGQEARPLRGVSQLGAGVGTDALLAAEEESESLDLATLIPLPASVSPRRILCVGLNYRSHIAETRRADSDYPVLFPKFASNLIPTGHDILIPPEATQPDWEGELAVVIGRPGRRITELSALDHVLGYTPANDVTMRDFQYRTHQWIQGKAWDGSTPLGSVIVEPPQVDLNTAAIRTIIDGETVQESGLDLMIFSIPRLIAEISVFTRLEEGDIILTGTPGGVGYRREPQRFLQPGNHVVVEIDGVGRIANGVAAEPPRDSSPDEGRRA